MTYKGVKIFRSWSEKRLEYTVDGEDLRREAGAFAMGYAFTTLVDAMVYIDAVLRGDIVE